MNSSWSFYCIDITLKVLYNKYSRTIFQTYKVIFCRLLYNHRDAVRLNNAVMHFAFYCSSPLFISIPIWLKISYFAIPVDLYVYKYNCVFWGLESFSFCISIKFDFKQFAVNNFCKDVESVLTRMHLESVFWKIHPLFKSKNYLRL